MTTSARLAAHRERAPAPTPAASVANSNPDPALSGEDEDDSTEKENEMTDKPNADKPVVAPASAAIDFNARMKAVFADDSVKGKETRAAAILADADFDGLSAEAIIKIVAGDASPAVVAASNGDDDPEFRTAALAALTTAPNPMVTPTGGEPAAKANHGWADIHAEVNGAS
jgi:hypothetical protein